MYKNDLPNRIKQSSQCCIYCGKAYKNRVNLDKHMNLCELIYKGTKYRKFIIEDEDDIPSQKKLYKMLLELGQKYSKLEEKVEEISKFVIKKKKKINVIEWLNTNITPEILFERLIDKIIVTEEDIDYLFKNSFYDTLNNIFLNNLYNLKDNEIYCPIFAFVQKPNNFYIYDKNQKVEWHELSREKLIKFLYKVHNKISKELFNWKQNRNAEINNNDALATSYDKTILKLMSIELKQESTISKIRSQIYQHMKTDMKALVEYEFEF
jgi:hypothetical protein